MDIIARIKVGFFEMRPYRLQVEKGRLLLVPVQSTGEESIILSERSILSVNLTEGRLPELEIQTRESLYSGTLEEGSSLAEVVYCLKEHLNINITCEYKGGEKHA